MTPIEIRIELLKRRITMSSIGREIGVSQPAVQRVIDRKMVSRRIMTYIAGLIGYPRESVFPEYKF